MINKWVMYSAKYSGLNRVYLIQGRGYTSESLAGMHFTTNTDKEGVQTLGVGFQTHLKESQIKCVLAPEQLGAWLDE